MKSEMFLWGTFLSGCGLLTRSDFLLIFMRNDLLGYNMKIVI